MSQYNPWDYYDGGRGWLFFFFRFHRWLLYLDAAFWYLPLLLVSLSYFRQMIHSIKFLQYFNLCTPRNGWGTYPWKNIDATPSANDPGKGMSKSEFLSNLFREKIMNDCQNLWWTYEILTSKNENSSSVLLCSGTILS